MTQATAMVMAGGTGGHVFPALATARVLERRGYRPYLVGAKDGPQAISTPQDGEILWRPN